MDCKVIEMLPTPEEYNRLRSAVGWGTYDPTLVKAALPHSLLCVCAVCGEQVVGMARVIGDGGLVYYIQDVIVLPAYQRQGFGARLMDAVMVYLGANVSSNSVIGLMAARDREPFYERYGFITRPNDMFGCGMTTNYQAVLSYQSHIANS
jgi:ribosomal protein S18 acetylase RimI-like enzyme